MTTILEGDVAVVSPHLDDAVLSLGASIARATRSGARVRVVTVLAGDPDSTLAAAPFDRLCGFATAGEAVRARRREDARACGLVGAVPVWLPFCDEQYERNASDDEVYAATATALEGATSILLPGYPLEHDDHAWLARLLLSGLDTEARLGLYVEQPYAAWHLVMRSTPTWKIGALGVALLVHARSLPPWSASSPVPGRPDPAPWLALSAGPQDWLTKQRAIAAYASQFPAIGHYVRSRIALWELGWGGEALAWI